MLRGLGAYVRGLLRRETIADEVNEELQFHLEMETRANVERGMTPREARRAALRDLGGVTQTREAVGDVRATFIDTAWQYMRFALRALRHNPGYTLVVTLVLAIGIAGSTFVYSVAEALLFRPIPYSDPDSLYLVSTALSAGGTQASVVPQVSHWELFERLRERHAVLDAIAAYSSRGANILGDGWSERLQVGAITHDFLSLVGVRPSPGRGFLATEFQPGHNAVALLTHSVWQRRFGGALDAIGRAIVVDDTPYTVVGVLPADVKSIDELETGAPTWTDNGLGVLVPLVGDPTLGRGNGTSSTSTLRVLGRLRQVRMLEAAREEVGFLARRLT
jgi:hypothetical protein